jgi:hypothetical protein
MTTIGKKLLWSVKGTPMTATNPTDVHLFELPQSNAR